MAAVSALSAARRYEYFVKKAADQNEVWGILEDGWVQALNTPGSQPVPIWPHKKYAEACASGDRSGGSVKKIELDLWMNSWLVRIAEAGRLIAVFPTPGDQGEIVDPARLIADLDKELAAY